MYCKNCGAEIDDKAVMCPFCGTEQKPIQQVDANDKGGFGYCLLGFCVPVAGLVLYLVWKDTKPLSSKSAGKGALISLIVSGVCYVLSLVLGIGAGLLNL